MRAFHPSIVVFLLLSCASPNQPNSKVYSIGRARILEEARSVYEINQQNSAGKLVKIKAFWFAKFESITLFQSQDYARQIRQAQNDCYFEKMDDACRLLANSQPYFIDIYSFKYLNKEVFDQCNEHDTVFEGIYRNDRELTRCYGVPCLHDVSFIRCERPTK